MPQATVAPSSSQAYVLDTIAPTLLLTNPADDATGASVSNNLTLTFSEFLANNSGAVYLYKSSDNSLVESFNVSTTTGSEGGTVAVSGATITLNPHTDLDYSTGYYLTTRPVVQGLPPIGHGDNPNQNIKDLADNAFDGIRYATTLNFTAEPAPAPGSIWLTPPTAAKSSPSRARRA